MKKVVFLSVLLFVVMACGGDGGVQTAVPTAGPPTSTPVIEFDAETGLPINPVPAPTEGEFIVMGKISTASLIPQDKPSFTVKVGSSAYPFTAQHIREIYREDGTQMAPHLIGPGLTVRATVQWGQEGGPGKTPGFFTQNMIILLADG